MTKERLRSRLADWYSRIIVVFAAAFAAQQYTIQVPPYLDLRKYALGQERMPFQARELMRYPLLWAGNSAFLQRHTTGRAGMNSPERLVLMLVTFAAILLSVWAAQKIDRMYWPKARVQLSVRLDVDDVSRLGPLSRTDGSVLVAADIVCGGDVEPGNDGFSDTGTRGGGSFARRTVAAAGGETA
jgi:hypothetical protein